MGLCLRISKIYLLVINILFLLVGLFLVGLSIYGLIKRDALAYTYSTNLSNPIDGSNIPLSQSGVVSMQVLLGK